MFILTGYNTILVIFSLVWRVFGNQKLNQRFVTYSKKLPPPMDVCNSFWQLCAPETLLTVSEIQLNTSFLLGRGNILVEVAHYS